MKNKDFSKSLKNLLWGTFGQAITIMLSLFIPRLFITHYGSEVNGLMCFIYQIFAYFRLLEAGLKEATMQAFYKPIVQKNTVEINQVMSTSGLFFGRIARYYIFLTLAFAFIYPFFVEINISKKSIAIIILIQGIVGAVNYIYQAPFRQLLLAEGKSYIVSNLTLVTAVVNNVTIIIAVNLGAGIVFVQFIYFIGCTLQVMFLYWYRRKYYKWINLKEEPREELLSQRKAIFLQQISTLIFTSADVIALTLFTNLTIVSIYAVYQLVIKSIKMIVSTFFSSTQFLLGKTFNKSKEKYSILHDVYHTYFVTLVCSIMGVCYILYIPFIEIYTKGADVNYVYIYLPLLLCISQMIMSFRRVSTSLIYIAGHAEQTTWASITETIIKLVSTFILVYYYGLYGAVIATIISLSVRTVYLIIYADKRILNRSYLKSFKPLIINTLMFLMVVYINSKISIQIDNFWKLMVYGVIISVILIPTYFAVVSLFCKKEFKFLYSIISVNVGKKLKQLKG